MAFGLPAKKPALFGPRMVIYTIILLAACWVMWRYDRNLQAEKTQARPGASSQEAIIPECAAGKPQAVLTLVVSRTEEMDAFYQELREEFQGKCEVTIVSADDSASEQTLRKVFGVDTLPAALLFDAENREIGRLEAPLMREGVREMVEKSLGE